MHRFSRTAQSKVKDGWGGSFILAAILTLALAYWAGNALSNWASKDAADLTSPNAQDPLKATGSAAIAQPHPFQIHMVQVGAFRSESEARKMTAKLEDQGIAAMMTARDADGYSRVYGGIFTSHENAVTAKDKLTTGGAVQSAVVKMVDVGLYSDSVPAASIGGSSAIKDGLDALNTYVYEATVWFENRALNGQADTANVATLEKKLSGIATALAGEKDTQIQKLAQAVTMADANAKDIEAAASAEVGSEEYTAAMSGYLTLVDQYRAYQGK